ncbi:MAG: mechanosensitive ion channel domain-containing protein [Solirubrobacterales bacterium]
MPDRDESTAPGEAAAQRGGPDDDATGLHDISYYRQSALARLMTAEAARRARKARREALLLLPVVAGLILLWVYREELFGTDVPIRIATALLLAAVGWRFARDLGRAVGPRLMRRFDPGTASTVSFLVQLVTLLVIVVVALRIVDLNPRAIALGGAVTAVVIGLAAQSTLGNVIAGIMLQASRPFRVGERVRMQGGPLGATVEGTVASQGLIYTTLQRGNGAILVPNNSALGATIVPLRAPAGVDLRARIRAGVKPSELQRMLAEEIRVPTRDEPDISLEEVHADCATFRVQATPVNDADGGRLADEVLAVVTRVAAESPATA